MDDLDDRITIGRFAALAEMSASQLRWYDQQGLLTPAGRDPESGYRYYRREQLRAAELIHLLRDVDMPLAEIRELLTGDDRSAIDSLLCHQRERIVARRAQDDLMIARLDRALDGEGLLPYDPRLVVLDPQWVISQRHEASLARLNELQLRAADELRAVAGAHGASSVEPEVVLYHSGLESIHGPVIDTEVCLPIPNESADAVPGAWLLPGGEAAALIHRGPWDEIRRAYVALYAWVAHEGLDVIWPARESYLITGDHTDDPREYVTSIAWLVDTSR
jgi:DNA-binding transcriptional MerR regulator